MWLWLSFCWGKEPWKQNESVWFLFHGGVHFLAPLLARNVQLTVCSSLKNWKTFETLGFVGQEGEFPETTCHPPILQWHSSACGTWSKGALPSHLSFPKRSHYWTQHKRWLRASKSSKIYLTHLKCKWQRNHLSIVWGAMGWQWKLASSDSSCVTLTTVGTQPQSIIDPLEIKEDRVFHLILRNSLAPFVSSLFACFSRWLHQVMEQSKECGTFPFSTPLAVFLPPLGLYCKQEPITLARRLTVSQSQNWHWAPLSIPAGAALHISSQGGTWKPHSSLPDPQHFFSTLQHNHTLTQSCPSHEEMWPILH